MSDRFHHDLTIYRDLTWKEREAVEGQLGAFMFNWGPPQERLDHARATHLPGVEYSVDEANPSEGEEVADLLQKLGVPFHLAIDNYEVTMFHPTLGRGSFRCHNGDMYLSPAEVNAFLVDHSYTTVREMQESLDWKRFTGQAWHEAFALEDQGGATKSAHTFTPHSMPPDRCLHCDTEAREIPGLHPEQWPEMDRPLEERLGS